MQTVPIFNRERPKAELVRITCCFLVDGGGRSVGVSGAGHRSEQ